MFTSNDIILTGDRPTGPLHLGHYAGSLRSRLQLQGRCTQTLLIIALVLWAVSIAIELPFFISPGFEPTSPKFRGISHHVQHV